MIVFWNGRGKKLRGLLGYSSISMSLLLTACGGIQCGAGAGQPVRIYDLYFGRAASGRAEIGEKDWRDFRDRVVTPALPNGYTVFDGQGAWMNPRSRTTISE